MFGEEGGAEGGGSDAANAIASVASAMFGDEGGGDIPYGQTTAPGDGVSALPQDGAEVDAFGDEGGEQGGPSMYGVEGTEDATEGIANSSTAGGAAGSNGAEHVMSGALGRIPTKSGSGSVTPQQQHTVPAVGQNGNPQQQQQVQKPVQQGNQSNQQQQPQAGQTSPKTQAGGSVCSSDSSDDDEEEVEQDLYQEGNQYQEENGGGGGGGGGGQGYSDPGYEPCIRTMRLKVFKKVEPPIKPVKRGGELEITTHKVFRRNCTEMSLHFCVLGWLQWFSCLAR